jgi:hypothetical protein
MSKIKCEYKDRAKYLWNKIKDETKLTYLEFENVIKYVYDICKESGLDFDSIDIESFDWSLSYYELISEIDKSIGLFKKREFSKDEIEAFEKLTEEKEKEFLKQQFEQQVEYIKNNYVDLDSFYGVLPQYLEMFDKGLVKALIITGKAGLGKTFQVLSKVSNIVKIGGHITAYQLYKKLYEYRENHKILFDDIEALLKSKECIAILKQALDTNEPRIISWFTTRKIGIPQQFEFNSSVVFCCNEIPNDVGFEPILSRCLLYKVDFDYHTILKIMYIIAKKDKEGLTSEERTKIVDFIKENSSITTEDFNLRLQDKLERFYLYCKNKYDTNETAWHYFETLGKELLGRKEEEKEILLDIIRKYSSVNEQIRQFMALTGKSRRTFFRYKKELMKVSKCHDL